MLLYTSPAVAATYQFNLNYLPARMTWNDAGNPITLFRVETQEDGVLQDYNAAAIAAANGFAMVGAQAANQVTLRIANGYIPNKNVTITLTTAAAAAIAFFGASDALGTVPFVFKNAAILANNPTAFKKFCALFIPTLAAATDRVEIDFKDGHRDTFAVADLLSLSSFTQEVAGIRLNNMMGYIHQAVVVAAANTPAYVLSYRIPGQTE
jgi:hypothetical protein